MADIRGRQEKGRNRPRDRGRSPGGGGGKNVRNTIARGESCRKKA